MRNPFDGTYTQTQNWNDPRYRASYAKFGLLGHNGEDYGCPAWTPILAPHKGIIKEATFDAGYGNYVKVESADEGSILAHLSKISVSLNQEVQEGQLIGYSGNTGNSTGAHLHWGYYRTRTRNKANGFNGYIDQTDWLDHKCPTVQPLVITDQTKIPQLGDLEVQAIRSKLGDLERDVKSLRDHIEEYKKLPQPKADEVIEETVKTYPVTPKTPPVSLDPEVKAQLVNLLNVLFRKLGLKK